VPQDSIYTDPDALRLLYLNPKNPLGGLTDPTGPPVTPTAPPPDPPPPNPPHCPAVGEWTWKYIGSKRGNLTHVRVGSLRTRVDRLYNPITQHFNVIDSIRFIENVPCLRVTTLDGAVQVVSFTHPVIQKLKDAVGRAAEHLMAMLEAGRVYGLGAVSCIDAVANLTKVKKIERAGLRMVAEIKLRKEHIFASGSSPDAMLCGHNKPREEGGGGGGIEP
jgi:hypothetical protein